MRRTRKLLAAIAAVSMAASAMIGMASADTIHTSDDVTKTAGSTGVATIRLVPGDNGDPVNGCNASAAHPVTVAVTSDSPLVTVDAPGTVEITGCSGATDEKTLGYSVDPAAPVGTVATITATAAAGTAGAPNGETGVVITGTGRDRTSTTVYPSYESSSFTVTVVQPTPSDPCAGRTAPAAAPSVTLNPASPNGSNDWYKTTAPTFTVSPATDAEYSLDDGTTWTAYTAAVTLTDGQHDVTARNFLPATTTPPCSRLDGPASTSQHVMVDTVNPSVAITSPDDLSNTLAGSVDVAGTFFDATSGVASITVNGQAATLNSTAGTFSRSALALACGENTITAVATDNAGNTNSDSVSVYRRCFTGAFQQPLDPNGVLNKAKLGRVVPVKLTITANDGGAVPTPVYFGYRQVPCATGTQSDVVEEYAAGSSNVGNTFRLSDGVWIYNLDTSKLPGAAVGACYQLDVYVSGTVNGSGIASGGVGVINGSVKIQLTK